MSPASLVNQLRAAGGSIRCDGGRLVIEAPPGVITAELRAELSKYKAELIALLESGTGNTGDAAETIQARNRIAGLLAMAYRRFLASRRPVEDQATSGDRRLANSTTLSVHGVVP
jgi:TubC N-terminal docking domain